MRAPSAGVDMGDQPACRCRRLMEKGAGTLTGLAGPTISQRGLMPGLPPVRLQHSSQREHQPCRRPAPWTPLPPHWPPRPSPGCLHAKGGRTACSFSQPASHPPAFTALPWSLPCGSSSKPPSPPHAYPRTLTLRLHHWAQASRAGTGAPIRGLMQRKRACPRLHVLRSE